MPSPSLLSKPCVLFLLFLKNPKPKPPCSTIHHAVSTVPPNRPRLRGVVFDMDGTLSVPTIDFQAMYKAVLGRNEYIRIRSHNPFGIDILHLIQDWGPDKQRRAYEVIADFEKQGLERLQIMPGAAELCGFLDSKNIRRGLITRNVKDAVDLFHQRIGTTFSPALSREFRPCKPDPELDLEPDFKVSSLNEVYSLLKTNFNLIP